MHRGACLTFLALLLAFSACTSTLTPKSADENDDREFTCYSASDCGLGEICIDGDCYLYCSETLSCPYRQVCDLESNGCREEVQDGDDTDDPADGDRQALDGDDPMDGDGASDGDQIPDGDPTINDGDVDLCADINCKPRRTCNPATGACDYDEDHCHLTACETPAICNIDSGICVVQEPDCANDGCPDGWVCLPSGDCAPNEQLYPTYCQPCLSKNDCAPGSHCLYDVESQEAFCAPPCQPNATCLAGASCNPQGTCQPDAYTCGNPHNIGGSCSLDADCVSGAICLMGVAGFSFPRGYCSRNCDQAHGDADCENPYGRCSGIRRESSDDYTFICLHICDNFSIYCREGYVCSPTSEPMRNVCLPQ